MFTAEGVIAHVLNDASAIGKSVRFPQVFLGRFGKALFQERFDLVFPQQVDDLFVGENGICRTEANHKQKDEKHKSSTP